MSRVLLKKLTVAHLVKKFPLIYVTQRFTAILSRSRHWSVS